MQRRRPVGSRPGRVVDMDLATRDFNIRLNLYGAFLGTKLGAEHFLAEGQAGAIVNIASLNSLVPTRFGAGYAAAKAGPAPLPRLRPCAGDSSRPPVHA
ncbi:hypothetical protein GCM10009862_25550 [Microbacterium binotii]|uniref:SDR family NAD(P)-dependent oxidoreductase n=2 Tax=Microbacterium binotii TaxID=462710 RepID=A0ABN3PH41_9MICO